MRLLIAMMKHETNTFSPVPTDWRRFEDWGLYRGEEVGPALAGTAPLLVAQVGSGPFGDSHQALDDVRMLGGDIARRAYVLHYVE